MCFNGFTCARVGGNRRGVSVGRQIIDAEYLALLAPGGWCEQQLSVKATQFDQLDAFELHQFHQRSDHAAIEQRRVAVQRDRLYVVEQFVGHDQNSFFRGYACGSRAASISGWRRRSVNHCKAWPRWLLHQARCSMTGGRGSAVFRITSCPLAASASARARGR